eukprot:452620_1
MNWNKSLSYQIICNQLKQQGNYINQLIQKDFNPNWKEMLIAKNEILYECLNNMMFDSDKQEINENILKEIHVSLKHEPILFVNSLVGYRSVDNIGLNTDCDAFPWLVTLDEEFREKYRYLFQNCLQVKRRFHVNDYVRILVELKEKYENKRVRDLDMVLLISKYVLSNIRTLKWKPFVVGDTITCRCGYNHKWYECEIKKHKLAIEAISDKKVSKPEQNVERIYIHYKGYPHKYDKWIFVKKDTFCDCDEKCSDKNHEIQTQKVDSMAVYLPDNNGVLYPSNKMVFNDAKWLTDSPCAKKFIFVHSLLCENENITKLGMKSFRNSVVSSIKRNCMGGDLIKKQLKNDKLGEIQPNVLNDENTENEEKLSENEENNTLLVNVMMSMLEIADVLGANEFEISVDENTYSTDSVLNERFKDCQMSSLLFKFDKSLNIEQLFELHDNIKSSMELFHFQQSGILPLYHLADYFSILSDDKFIVFGPHSQYSMKSKGLSEIFTFVDDESKEPGLVEQFPHQFQPFVPFGLKDNESFPGTIIRVPLRTYASSWFTLSNIVYNEQCRMQIPLRIKDHLTSCLIFSSNVKHVIISQIKQTEHIRDVLYESNAIDTNQDDVLWRKIVTQDKLMHYLQQNNISSKYYQALKSKTPLTIISNYTIFNNKHNINGRLNAPKYANIKCSVGILQSSEVKQDDHNIDTFAEVNTCPLNRGYLFVNGCPAIKSNLPLHINGSFTLNNQCRYDLFDEKNLSKDIKDLNHYLYTDEIPRIYTEALLAMKKIQPQNLYKFWPTDWNKISLNLNILQKTFCLEASKKQLFLSSQSASYLSAKKSWFPSLEMSKNATEFVSNQCDLFIGPKYVVGQLKSEGINIKEFKPKDFRLLLHKKDCSLSDWLTNITSTGLIFDLLQFCLSDLSTDSSELPTLRG